MYLTNLIFEMTMDEKTRILTNDFDTLWKELWINSYNNKKFMKEYKLAQNKFNKLKECNFYNLLDDNLSNYDEPEWEFPKGKRNIYENIFDCAKREFYEETNIDTNQLSIYNSNVIEEEFKGTNNLNYKNIYYYASSDDLHELISTDEMNYEIGDIKWFTINDAISIIRPYYVSKIKIIYQTYLIIYDIIMKNNNSLLYNIV